MFTKPNSGLLLPKKPERSWKEKTSFSFHRHYINHHLIPLLNCFMKDAIRQLLLACIINVSCGQFRTHTWCIPIASKFRFIVSSNGFSFHLAEWNRVWLISTIRKMFSYKSSLINQNVNTLKYARMKLTSYAMIQIKWLRVDINVSTLYSVFVCCCWMLPTGLYFGSIKWIKIDLIHSKMMLCCDCIHIEYLFCWALSSIAFSKHKQHTNLDSYSRNALTHKY